MKGFMAYVNYKDISWRGDRKFETEALVIGQNHLIMRQINFYIGIGHFFPFNYKTYDLQHSKVVPIR